jgi:hypothetical protein
VASPDDCPFCKKFYVQRTQKKYVWEEKKKTCTF